MCFVAKVSHVFASGLLLPFLLNTMILGNPNRAWADIAASARPAPALSLSDCIRLAEQNVPLQLLQRARLLEAQAQLTQARTLPNPTASYMAQDLGLSAQNAPLLLHQAMLSFPPFVALLRVQEARIACANQDRTQAAVAEERRQLRLAVGRAFYELRLAQQLTEVEQQAVTLTGELLAQNQQRQAHGEGSGLDVLRAQAEQVEARRSADAAAQRQLLLGLAFSLLLGADSPTPLTLLPDDVASPELAVLPLELSDLAAAADAAVESDALLKQLRQQASEHHPELRRVQAEARGAQELARLATLRTVPFTDLQLAGGVRVSAVGTGAVLALSSSLPLLDWNQGARQRAQAQLLAARAQQVQVARQVRLDVESSYRDFVRARAALHRQTLPLCKLRTQILSAVRKQFAEGVIPLGEVFVAQRDLLIAQRSAAQGERDMLTARWQLAAALGAW